jgi:hypothetical protein
MVSLIVLEEGGDALGLLPVADEEAIGDGARVDCRAFEEVAEAGMAAVFEGVDVAGLGAGAGAFAAALRWPTPRP